MTWLIFHYLLIINYIYIAISVDNRWQPLTKSIGLLSFISSRWHFSGIYLYSLFFIKKKSIDIEGVWKSKKRAQGRCQQSPDSTPEYMPPIENTLFFWCRPTLNAFLGWKMDECLSNSLQGVSQNPTKSPKIPHCITRKLLSHKGFLRNFTASNAYAYDRLEEHLDSDSSRPELHHQGSLPVPRGTPMHYLRLHQQSRATPAFYPDLHR